MSLMTFSLSIGLSLSLIFSSTSMLLSPQGSSSHKAEQYYSSSSGSDANNNRNSGGNDQNDGTKTFTKKCTPCVAGTWKFSKIALAKSKEVLLNAQLNGNINNINIALNAVEEGKQKRLKHQLLLFVAYYIGIL